AKRIRVPGFRGSGSGFRIPRFEVRGSTFRGSAEPRTPEPRNPGTCDDPSMPDLAAGLAYYIAFLFSTTLHEASHAWAAFQGGEPTAYHGGQVSLDPWPHIRR